MTQEEVAEAMGTTKATISRMESGTREPNLGYLAAFAEAIGHRPADLFRLPDAPPFGSAPARSPGAGLHDASEEELALALKLIRTARKKAS